jgi:hypothetical protein
MKLTDTEIKLFLSYLENRKRYKPCGQVLGYPMWQDWMDDTIQKLNDELNP